LCGLPVITTNVPPIAKVIKKKNAGFVIPYSEEDLINSLETLLRNEKTFSLYSTNAIKLSNTYDDTLILERAFRRLPNSF
jgi:glycosyltransferase involved in cell wall biosynthesis